MKWIQSIDYIFSNRMMQAMLTPLSCETQDGTWGGGTEFNMTKDAPTGLTGNAVEYYLDGVKQADLAPYASGFNAPGSREVWVVGAKFPSGKLYSVCVNQCWNGRRDKVTQIDSLHHDSTGILVANVGVQYSKGVGMSIEIEQDSMIFTCDPRQSWNQSYISQGQQTQQKQVYL